MDSATDQTSFRSFVFDQWLLQSDGTLMRDGKGIHVPPKELHVLRLLLGSTGTVISKDVLLDSVWPNTDAAEESLTRCIYALRKLLKENKSFIATVYGHGYRFTCPAVTLDSPDAKAVAIPSLAVLPFRGMEAAAALDLQDLMIRQWTAAFGEAVRFVPAGLMASFNLPVDAGLLVQSLAPDYYLSGRVVGEGVQLRWSVELIRGRDHALLHGQILDGGEDNESLAQLACLIAQQLPGLRPIGGSCTSYSAAVAYLKGVCSLQRHTPQSLRDALVQFGQCLEQASGYAPSWCGVADAWLGHAVLGLCDQEHAIQEADSAISKALSLDPCNLAALARLALLTSLRGCEAAAQALFRRCLMAADQADVHYFHAWHHWFWRRNEQASQSIERCLRHDSGSVRAQVLRVRIALTHMPQEALSMARKTLGQGASGHSLLIILHAVVLAYLGHHQSAWRELDQAGLHDAAMGEQGLAAWNVLFGVNPLNARNQYAMWLYSAQFRSIELLDASPNIGLAVAPLWRSLSRGSNRIHFGTRLMDSGRRLA